MRYLGIDYGERRVGLALSDDAGTMGFPNRVVPNSPHLLEIVAGLIEHERVGAVVIGESRDLAGGENEIAKAARQFGKELATRTRLPVHYESEVYTSAEARRQYDREEKSRAPKARAHVDDSAAALILTSYLSKQHG
jgi:putative Holliday junction resolvase